MAKHLAYSHPSDVLTAAYSGSGLTSSGTDYPFTALGTLDPSEVFLSVETSGRIIADLGAKTEVQAVFLGHHRFAAAKVLQLEANDTGTFVGAQPFDQSVTVPAWRKDGFARHLWWDVATRVPVQANRSWRYWSLQPTTANDVAIAAGLLLFLGTLRRLGRNIAWDVDDEIDHDEIRNSTKFGVQSVYELGSKARSVKATVPQANDVTRIAIEDWREDARSGNRPFFVAPCGDELASDLLREPRFVEWTGGPLAAQWNFLELHQVRLNFADLSCGKPY